MPNFSDGGGGEPLDGGSVENVGGDGEAAGAARLDALNDAGEVVLTACGDHHIGAGISHREGDALTDPRPPPVITPTCPSIRKSSITLTSHLRAQPTGRGRQTRFRGPLRLALAEAPALKRLALVDALGAHPEDVGRGPAIEAGVGIDLAAVMDLVLDQHHEDAPAGERGIALDEGDAALEPLVGGFLQTGLERGGALFEGGRPALGGGGVGRGAA